MENYKIKVNNEAESKEIQELFFELGYYWFTGLGVKNLGAKFLYAKNNKITMGYCSDNFSDVDYREITIAELRDMVAAHRKPTEQGLISGADALRALADGEEVEFKTRVSNWNLINKNDAYAFSLFLDDDSSFSFRLKPRNITLNMEIPAPFEPKIDDGFWHISTENDGGYAWQHFENRSVDYQYIQFGAWRTEDEIKQVVAALRGALNNG